MATRAHQFIADLVARRMNIDGYEVVSFEGENSSEEIKLKLPPKILRHRPDLIGTKQDSLAIGEAKTANDFRERTKEQLEDFTEGLKLIGQDYKVYLGIPLSAEDKVNRMIKLWNINTSYLDILTIPDRLLPYDESDDI